MDIVEFTYEDTFNETDRNRIRNTVNTYVLRILTRLRWTLLKYHRG